MEKRWIMNISTINFGRVAVALGVLPLADSVQSAVVYLDLDPNREVATPSDPVNYGQLKVLLSDLFPDSDAPFGGYGFSLHEGRFPTQGSQVAVTQAAIWPVSSEGFRYSTASYTATYPTSAVMGSETSTTKSFSVSSLEALSALPELSMRGFYFTDASSDFTDASSDRYYGWMSYGFRNAGVINPEAPASEQVYSIRPFISEVAFETTANTAITIGDKDGSAQNPVSEPMTLPLVAAGIAGIAAARCRSRL